MSDNPYEPPQIVDRLKLADPLLARLFRKNLFWASLLVPLIIGTIAATNDYYNPWSKVTQTQVELFFDFALIGMGRVQSFFWPLMFGFPISLSFTPLASNRWLFATAIFAFIGLSMWFFTRHEGKITTIFPMVDGIAVILAVILALIQSYAKEKAAQSQTSNESSNLNEVHSSL